MFFNHLGEIRDCSFEQQRYPASGLNLIMAAVVLWNTVYLERAAHALRGNGHAVDQALLQYLSPLGGNTSTWPEITFGAAAPRSARASSGRYGR